MSGLSIFPAEASVTARTTDQIFFVILALSVAIVLLVLALIVTFAIRYRRGSKANRAALPKAFSREVEIGWTVGTLFLALFIFWFASSLQLNTLIPPKDALEIHVVARQWMWKTQHPSGAREINSLHAPVGVPVRLVMTSQDVIHSFFVPAFRMKQDVLPGRYTQTWFKATRPGVYPLYCAEYCGTDHSRMTGEIVIMPVQDYGRWTAAQPQPDDLAGQGFALFRSLGCSSCHDPKAPGFKAPDLRGLYGRQVKLADGRTLTADEGYLRDSILLPEKDQVAGYPPIMPDFSKTVDEGQTIELVAYLKSLSARPGAHS